MTQTVVPETPAAAHRVEPVSSTGEVPLPHTQDAGGPRVTLRKRLSQLLDFHPAVGVADIVFPAPRDRNRR